MKKMKLNTVITLILATFFSFMIVSCNKDKDSFNVDPTELWGTPLDIKRDALIIRNEMRDATSKEELTEAFDKSVSFVLYYPQQEYLGYVEKLTKYYNQRLSQIEN